MNNNKIAIKIRYIIPYDKKYNTPYIKLVHRIKEGGVLENKHFDIDNNGCIYVPEKYNGVWVQSCQNYSGNSDPIQLSKDSENVLSIKGYPHYEYEKYAKWREKVQQEKLTNINMARFADMANDSRYDKYRK